MTGLGDPKRARLVGLPTVESAIERGSFICGPPDYVKERLMEVQEAYPGVEEIMVGAPAATMPEQPYPGTVGVDGQGRHAGVQVPGESSRRPG